MSWFWIIILVLANNWLWFVWFISYRTTIMATFHQSGKDHYENIREAQQLAFSTITKVELQARANALYEAADLLSGIPEAVVSRTELLERRNKVLEKLNGVYEQSANQDLTDEEIDDMRKGLHA